ncbi:MAG: hypothetical protein HYZ26_06425 [Chloroflexi bacterium]|nr:hypothetical protein [Chloroflexota bacterium]
MHHPAKSFILICAGLVFALTACNLPSATPTPDFSAIVASQAAATLSAEQTRSAGLPSATATLSNPPSATQPAASATNVPATQVTRCNWAAYVTDVTIPDGTLVTPGQDFVKTWRLKNVGTCTWSSGYELVFVDGNRMEAGVAVPIGTTVAPGQSADLSITFKAPSAGGTYRGNWKLRSADGLVFGIGGDANQVFWVEVKAREANKSFLYDFAINYCQAQWRSAAEDDLACPGDDDSADGWVILLDDVRLENRLEDEPTLWVHADEAVNSWITGEYPAVAIQNGDRFRAWVGCLDSYTGCQVRFKVEYIADGGPITLLAEWDETHDANITEVNLDLSALAGKNVKFILSMVITGGKPRDAMGFWFVPRLIRP